MKGFYVQLLLFFFGGGQKFVPRAAMDLDPALGIQSNPPTVAPVFTHTHTYSSVRQGLGCVVKISCALTSHN